MKGTLQDREQGKTALIVCQPTLFTVCVCGGVWMERCWHDTLALWNIVNMVLHVEQDILQYVVELKCLLMYQSVVFIYHVDIYAMNITSKINIGLLDTFEWFGCWSHKIQQFIDVIFDIKLQQLLD